MTSVTEILERVNESPLQLRTLQTMHIRNTVVDMHGYVDREQQKSIISDLKIFPALALLGPRQVGKSTLVKKIAESRQNCLYLDLESPADKTRMMNPELFLEMNRHKMIILDEVQVLPEIFPILRSEIDKDRRPGRFILLGSASKKLINRSSESLAGRINYLELNPFSLTECVTDKISLFRLLTRGGFPESFLAGSDEASFRWRMAFIRSYVERDLPLLGLKAPTPLVERLLRMTAHLQGQPLNSHKMAESLGISPSSIRNYLDFLEEALLVRQLPSWGGNLKKRLVKAPRIYLRDTGIAAMLLRIGSYNEMMGHPEWGALWETLVVENVCNWFPMAEASYFRTSNGAEIDLVLESGSTRILIEAKASMTPSLTKGFWTSRDDLSPQASFICAPVEMSYPVREDVIVTPLIELKKRLIELGLGKFT